MDQLLHDDPSATPGAETKEALIAAAMAQFDVAGSSAMLFPVPGTNPPLFVAAGTLESLYRAITTAAKPNVG